MTSSWKALLKYRDGWVPPGHKYNACNYLSMPSLSDTLYRAYVRSREMGELNDMICTWHRLHLIFQERDVAMESNKCRWFQLSVQTRAAPAQTTTIRNVIVGVVTTLAGSVKYRSMANALDPLLMHWRYCSLALSHRDNLKHFLST